MPDPHLRPPRPELLALLDAAKDHPDDDTPRLVLADWLDEQDNPLDAERAAFIRADVAFVRGTGPLPDYTPERFRRWLGPVVDLANNCGWDRGLPWLYASAPRLLKGDARALLATEAFAFVHRLMLNQATGPRLEKLVARPEFRHVTGLIVRAESTLGARPSACVFGSPNLAGMRQLGCRDFGPGLAGIRALADNPALARLRKLALTWNKIDDLAAAVLAASPRLAKLTELDLSENSIGDAGAKSLAASPHLANLRELELRFNPRLTPAGKRLLRDAFGDRVSLD